jgi:hypothetical protein
MAVWKGARSRASAERPASEIGVLEQAPEAREVLDRRGDAAVHQSLGEGGAAGADRSGATGEGARGDESARRERHVEHRRQVEVDAEGVQVAPGREPLRARGGHARHDRGRLIGRTGEPLDRAALLVGRDQKRELSARLCRGLQSRGQGAGSARRAEVIAEEDDAADLAVPDALEQEGARHRALHAHEQVLANELRERRLLSRLGARALAGRQRERAQSKEKRCDSARRHCSDASRRSGVFLADSSSLYPRRRLAIHRVAG